MTADNPTICKFVGGHRPPLQLHSLVVHFACNITLTTNLPAERGILTL